MAANRQVSVKVNLSAGGNLGQVTQNMIAGMTQASRMTGGAGTNWVAAAMAKAQPTAQLPTAALPFAKLATDVYWKQAKDNLGKLAVGAGVAALAMTGFAAAASPALVQTLGGSIHLLSGEIGIMLIPAIVEVSKFMQGLAGYLRDLNAATGGMIGQILKAVAVPVTLILLGSAVAGAVGWIYSMSTAAAAATRSLGILAGASGTHWMTAAMGGTGVGRAGRGASMAGLGAGFALSAGSNMLGSAIGGNTGNAISTIGGWAGTGAMIGSVVPFVGTAIGAGIGAIIGAIQVGFGTNRPAAGFNFQQQTSNIEDMHDIIQREALRDPLQQATAEQQAQATRDLAREIGFLSSAISRYQPWQVNS